MLTTDYENTSLDSRQTSISPDKHCRLPAVHHGVDGERRTLHLLTSLPLWGCSVANLLTQVHAAQGGIAAAEMLSLTTGQMGAKGGGTLTKPGQSSWAEVV